MSKSELVSGHLRSTQVEYPTLKREASMTSPQTVLIASGSGILNKGLGILLSESPILNVVGYTDISAVVSQARKLKPEIIVMDLSSQADEGLSALGELRKQSAARVLVVADRFRPGFVREAIRQGAKVLVSMDGNTDELNVAVTAVAQGERYLPKEPLKSLFESIRDGRESSVGIPEQQQALTSRESDVMVLVAEGLKDWQIAEKLGIAVSTVRNYMTSIFHKLGSTNRTKASVRFLEDRLGT